MSQLPDLLQIGQPGLSPEAPAIAVAAPVTYRKFGDIDGTRDLIFKNVFDAASAIQPVSNPRYSLAIEQPKWVGPERYTLADQKKAILSRGTLSRRLTGTAHLRDAAGNTIATRNVQLAKVPYMTDRGTFIMNGNEYTISHQMRLLPGVFTRRQQNGELESHVNVSKGYGHRIYLDPETGVFRIKLGQAKIPLLPLLKAMGVSESDLRKAWGNELTAVNIQKNDTQALGKIYQKLYRNGKDTGEAQKAAILKAFSEMTLDPEVTKRTLGKSYDRATPETLLAITQKLLRVNKNEEEPDDRDALAFQRVVGPEDLFTERLHKAKDVLRRALWKATPTGSLDKIGTNLYDDAIHSIFMGSGLAMPLEEINTGEIFDQHSRVTRMGEGGIPSSDAVPDEARSVQPSQFGFIDFIRTPESGRVGVDLRMARAAMKGNDGRIYTPVRNIKTGEQVLKSPQDLADAVIAFPGELQSGEEYVDVLDRGRLRNVHRKFVDYEVPQMEDTFSPLGNLVPMKSSVKGQRAVMAARMITQALPVKDAEAPFVQSGMVGGERSYEEEYADKMGAVRASQGGRVIAVDDGTVHVQYDDGKKDSIELYHNFPFNRKSFIHQTATVAPGQVFAAGDLLAKSNFTDAKGVTALGKNARVAYIPWGGLNFEDAIVVSKSFADKMKSEHMYQHEHAWEQTDKRGTKAVSAIFPGKYNRETLANFTDDGVIKPGTRVKQGDPLILRAAEKERNKKSILGGGKPSFSDESVIWDHSHDGVVTDVTNTDKGSSVVVKTYMPMEVGDKLCFDPETELMTETGWKRVSEIQYTDRLATLNPVTDVLEWHTPDNLHAYPHTGSMYKLVTKHLDMLVTPNHDLWVSRPHGRYQKIKAIDFYNSKGEWQFKKDCKWSGQEQSIFQPLPLTRYTSRENQLSAIPMDTWLEFLGYYIAEGRTLRTSSGGYQVQISQFRKSEAWADIAACLTDMGVRWSYNKRDNRFEINSKHLHYNLQDCGRTAYTKRIPAYVHTLSARQLGILFDAYMDGDGHRGACWEYGTSSRQLAFDLEVLLLKIGMGASTRPVDRSDNFQKTPHWRVRINRKHLRPWWKKSRVAQYAVNEEELVDYAGMVYCVTVSNHLVYAKRGGKSYWSGNSGRYG